MTKQEKHEAIKKVIQKTVSKDLEREISIDDITLALQRYGLLYIKSQGALLDTKSSKIVRRCCCWVKDKSLSDQPEPTINWLYETLRGK